MMSGGASGGHRPRWMMARARTSLGVRLAARGTAGPPPVPLHRAWDVCDAAQRGAIVVLRGLSPAQPCGRSPRRIGSRAPSRGTMTGLASVAEAPNGRASVSRSQRAT
jgi:hypothetical protein